MGADHVITLVLEAVTARIDIALGEANADALREVVARMRMALGSEHSQTQKYEKVLNI